MSSVTNVIALLSPIDDDDPPGPIRALSEWLLENGHQGQNDAPLVRVDQHAGGPKAFEANVWIGAMNYLDLEAFQAFARKLRETHEDAATLQVLVLEEGRDYFWFALGNPCCGDAP